MTWLETLRSRKLIVPMLAIFIALLVQTSWVEEDAFITLRTSYNFIHGYGLRWNIDERVQTFTNPLWMFILAGAHAFIANPYITLILVSIITSALTLFVLLIYIPQNNFGLLLAFATLILSKSFVDFSTSGLENPATHLLAVSFVALYFKAEKPLSDKNRFFLSLLAGLAAFNRMDTLLFYLPALIVLLRNQFNKRTFLTMLAGFSPFILWEIFSFIYYGFPAPNTYYAKLNTGVPLSEELTQGILYFLNSSAGTRSRLPSLSLQSFLRSSANAKMKS
jgi:arabinofuranosyltransferase